MAQSVALSQKELERVANEAYVGKTLYVMLCVVGATGFTAQSTVTQWQSTELSGNGYVRYSEVVTAGSYNGTTGRFELPIIDAEFTTTSSYVYDSIVLYFSGESYVHSVITESPNIALVSGQVQTYRIKLNTDD